jgi:HPr kinase/phosphorylase
MVRQDGHEYDRLGLEQSTYELLGVKLPLQILPLRQGRNITTLVEVAARNQLLKEMGYHSAVEFEERLEQRMAETARIHAHSIIGDNLE